MLFWACELCTFLQGISKKLLSVRISPLTPQAFISLCSLYSSSLNCVKPTVTLDSFLLYLQCLVWGVLICEGLRTWSPVTLLHSLLSWVRAHSHIQKHDRTCTQKQKACARTELREAATPSPTHTHFPEGPCLSDRMPQVWSMVTSPAKRSWWARCWQSLSSASNGKQAWVGRPQFWFSWGQMDWSSYSEMDALLCICEAALC